MRNPLPSRVYGYKDERSALERIRSALPIRRPANSDDDGWVVDGQIEMKPTDQGGSPSEGESFTLTSLSIFVSYSAFHG